MDLELTTLSSSVAAPPQTGPDPIGAPDFRGFWAASARSLEVGLRTTMSRLAAVAMALAIAARGNRDPFHLNPGQLGISGQRGEPSRSSRDLAIVEATAGLF